MLAAACLTILVVTSFAGVPIVGILVAAALAATLLLRTQVTITSDGVDVRLSPLFHRHIPADEIVGVRSRTVSPLREFGGWGLRKKRRATALLLGPRAVELELSDGHLLVVSLSEPDWRKAAALALPER